MSDSLSPLNLPPLREHDFQSTVPIVGSLIRSVRRGLYSLTAKWSTRALIQQQTDINAALVQRVNVLVQHVKTLNEQMAEQSAWLIEQDREVVALTRTVAELQAQARWLAKRRQSITDGVTSESVLSESGSNGG